MENVLLKNEKQTRFLCTLCGWQVQISFIIVKSSYYFQILLSVWKTYDCSNESLQISDQNVSEILKQFPLINNFVKSEQNCTLESIISSLLNKEFFDDLKGFVNRLFECLMDLSQLSYLDRWPCCEVSVVFNHSSWFYLRIAPTG